MHPDMDFNGIKVLIPAQETRPYSTCLVHTGSGGLVALPYSQRPYCFGSPGLYWHDPSKLHPEINIEIEI